MGFSFTLEKGNYRQYDFMIIYFNEHDLLSYLCNQVSCPNTTCEISIWKGHMTCVFKVIFYNVNYDILESLIHFECPHALWTHIWELYGDHDTLPSLADFLSDSHVPLHFLEPITHVCDPMQDLEILDEIVDASKIFDYSSKIVD